ncbi:MAG: hypothetical protein ACYCUW_01675 [bacterium]
MLTNAEILNTMGKNNVKIKDVAYLADIDKFKLLGLLNPRRADLSKKNTFLYDKVINTIEAIISVKTKQ